MNRENNRSKEDLNPCCVTSAQQCILTLKNVDRLKNLVGQHGVGKNPNELVNLILDRYFELLDATVSM